MSRLDCSSAEIKGALEEISGASSGNDWAVFGYVPKSGNVIKVDGTGKGFEDFVEEFSEGKVQFGYWRVPVKTTNKFVYVAWCGDGVTGMAKGSFGNHTIDFGNHLKKSFAVHHQVNARSVADLDEKKINAALIKAGGANYDAGAKKQGQESVNKAMGELKTFHISEQQRAVETGTGREGTGVQIDKGASDQFWSQNKAAPKQPAAAPSRAIVDEEERKRFWQQQQAEKEAAQQALAQKQQQGGRPAPAGNAGLRSQFEQPSSGGPPKTSAPPPRPAPGKINSPFTSGGPPSNAPPKTSAPPPARPAPVSAPPPVTSAPPPARPAPAAVPPRMPDPETAPADDWDEPASNAAPPAQEQYAQEEYPAQEEYAQEEYAQEEYAQEEYPAQEEYAQEEYAQEEYAQEEYAQEEYPAQEEYAQEEYAQEEYAQEEYAQDGSAQYEQVQAMHDYAGSHDEDLSFAAGDWITVHEKDESGWWKGEVNGKIGYFPSNFVQQ